jgi:hypothetical protein
MSDVSRHQAHVDAWLGRVASPSVSTQRLAQLLEEAIGAIWARAQLLLGDPAMEAITVRVALHAKRRFPVLSPLEVTSGGVSCLALRHTPPALAEELREALRSMVVELLVVLGSLTAGVLTPALHEELDRVPTRMAPASTTSRPRPA